MSRDIIGSNTASRQLILYFYQMKILTAEQIRTVDEATIISEPIASIELMERAARKCADRIAALVHARTPIHIFCGKGNNGGDGLAIARLLSEQNYNCKVYIIHFRPKFSGDAEKNYQRLNKTSPEVISEIKSFKDLPDFSGNHHAVAVDALLGTGINAAPKDLLKDTIEFINKHYSRIISVDVPSGLKTDGAQEGQSIILSSLTLSFQLPKLAFMLPENAKHVPEFELLDINLSEKAINEADTDKYFVTAADIKTLIKKRPKFSHKGNYGHALLMAGSSGKSGAAIMAAEATLRSGAGLLTVHSTATTIQTLLQRLPEAMSSADENPHHISSIEKPENYSALAFGPGTGTHEETAMTLKKILQHGVRKLVLDADALNILSENKTWLEFLPANCIITPHPGEFKKLSGDQEDDMARLSALQQFSLRYNCITILKGAHTAIAMPDGNLFFNSSGNPGLAKGGSGDVLTGILLGLLSSGYNAPQSALIGVYIHGLAADLCAEEMGLEGILASDVIKKLPAAFKMLQQ